MIPAPAFDVEGDGSFIPNGWEWCKPDGTVEILEDNPVAYVPPLGFLAERLAEAYDRSILPAPGSLLQQPARAMELIRIWRRAIAQCEAQKAANQEAKQRRAGNGN